MSSELRVDKIIPTGGIPTGGGGGVIQVVQKLFTTTFTSNVYPYTDITGFELDITPKFNTSKILVIVDQPYHMSRSSNSCAGGFKIFRDSTAIATPNGTGSSGGSSPYACSYTATGASYVGIIDRWSFMILDEPASTSALVYKVQMACQTGNDSGRIRAQYSGTSGDQKGHIVLLEISA